MTIKKKKGKGKGKKLFNSEALIEADPITRKKLCMAS
jgi:hypothetical protein